MPGRRVRRAFAGGGRGIRFAGATRDAPQRAETAGETLPPGSESPSLFLACAELFSPIRARKAPAACEKRNAQIRARLTAWPRGSRATAYSLYTTNIPLDMADTRV